MKRICLLVIVAISMLGPAVLSADAFHGHGGHRGGHHGHHHHGGWGHFGGGGGYRHWGGHHGGWGGHRHFGYVGHRTFYGSGFGYRPFYGYGYAVGYRPFYGVGFGYGLGGYGYGGSAGYYYPAYYSDPYLYNYSQPYFYNQSPYFYNSSYGYPTCFRTPVINVSSLVVIRKPASLVPAAGAPSPAMGTIAVPKRAVIRSSTVAGRSKARQQVKLGDAAFLAGRYVDALTRYRTASEAAPDNADAHFRKGHAYIANGKYELAATSFRRGLELDPTANLAGFRLGDLYGVDSVAKGVHLENLAAAALMDEDSADSYLLLGLMLRFDGESDRAEKFFAKAAALSPEVGKSVAAFLPAKPLVAEFKETPVSLALGDET